MQEMVFTAHCDVEIGDEVITTFAKIATTIIDIRTVSYLKSGKVDFEFELAMMPGVWRERRDFMYTPKGGTT